MTTYSARFENHTDQSWTLAIYHTFPHSLGKSNVSWKQVAVSGGESGEVRWDLTYSVVLADYLTERDRAFYRSFEVRPADPGTAWSILLEDERQRLMPAKNSPAAEKIVFENWSDHIAYPGIGIDGVGSIYTKPLYSGTRAQFDTQLVFWAGLFDHVAAGEIIRQPNAPPKKLVYPKGSHQATVRAQVIGAATLALEIRYD